jgi:hypothetical protein
LSKMKELLEVNKYYEQWSADEISSLHGVEISDRTQNNESDIDLNNILDLEEDKLNCQEDSFSPCMEDYMLSWRDFL